MANPEHVEILEQGVEEWNEWRLNTHEKWLDLSGADFSNADLVDADLRGVDLTGADLAGANLSDADLTSAYLGRANLIGANISSANLSGADLIGAELIGTNLDGSNLAHADLSTATVGYLSLTNTDLNGARGLETVAHVGPSEISISTIYRSQGKIPALFLRGCGVPEDFVTYMHAITVQPIQFYSCFISYSHRDEDFAQRLYSRMRSAGLQVWYAPEEMKGGRKLHEQIFGAIHVHDKLLLVLSENSLRSEWVATEIRRARKAEGEEGRRKLFPIRLVDFEAIRAWECFDADSGKDLGVELREYFIPDFSDWKDHDAFEKAFERLLRDLKAEEKKP